MKPVDYDRWSELYWKRELEKLEKGNMKVIEEVYGAMVGDREVQAWIERIKGHEWVKVVER